MALYQLKTSLVHSKIEQFDSDKKAWDTLRLSLPEGKLGVLFIQSEMNVPIINKKSYKKSFFKKYGEKSKADPANTLFWTPVAKGITSHSYDINKKITTNNKPNLNQNQ